MNVQSVKLLKQSTLMNDYKNRKESIYEQFQYDPYQLRSFKKRYEYLVQQSYKREQLVDVLMKQNKRWSSNQHVINNIQALSNKESVVIIGGQQAGILTGPLYTIHKIISIILQAKEQQDYLQKPVIPVFWIAGEDHDFEEVNHLFVYEQEHLKKKKINATDPEKTPVSNRKIDKDFLKSWVDELFKSLKETANTKELYQLLTYSINQSETYVDYFALLVQHFFSKEGLVLVDSNDSNLRHLEHDYFVQMIQHQEEIAQSVVNELEVQEKKGYTIALDATTEDGHLFYHLNGERLLMEKYDGCWVSKDGQIKFTEDEFIKIAKESPHLLSNNVVTRPIMQEMVFPVLSFIGGPGEIAYWSVLKPTFEIFKLQFPIITPRMSLTLFEPSHEKWCSKYDISYEHLLSSGTYQYKMNWLRRQTSSPINDLILQTKKEISAIHQPLQDLAKEIQDDLAGFTESNLKEIHKELDVLEKRFQKELKQKNEHTIQRFDRLDHLYFPKGGLQERTWNLVYFLNVHGLDLPQKLLETPPRWEQDHLMVTL